MKIASIKHNEQDYIAVVNDAAQVVSPIGTYRSMKELIKAVALLKIPDSKSFNLKAALPFDAITWLAPLNNPQKILCVGRNYREHAAEMGAEVAEIPVIFSKVNSSLIGHDQAIHLPEISQAVDYEAELVVVVGKGGRNIAIDKANEHVFGFCCGNDVTARDWQKGKPGGQWLLGKSFDTFGPIGPWVVTADELSDPHNLEISLHLNGFEMQHANTRELIFDIPFLIAHLSKFMTLSPGDLIFTGTPSGVGSGRSPAVFLQAGDVVEVKISEIGTLRNVVVADC
ncbi:MAG TPA: fumarylacetoacetate hydrolase family protein [Pirellulaceae bacterium]|nr:fumarylacetoacetate hydrolase family protein [Pirellulaceae bacterium]HMO90694.1 fumarylacetoacetate hydrolase family protein [Pirellulaceae bacterium]HMP67727.1 fumarylacetoacetate hydrolase family protein [Pirellulaceae bacterium]